MPVQRIAVLAFFLSLTLLYPARAPAQSNGIEWVPVARATLVEKVRLDGSVEAVQESTVSAQTAGTIMELPFDVDDQVEQGALIARLEDTEQRSRLRQAEGNREEAEASLLDARQQFERIESLYRQDVASRSDFDEARNRLDGARARFVRAEAAVAEAREELDYTRVEAPYSGVVTARHVEVGESVRPGQPLLSGFSLDELRVVAGVPQRYVEHAQDASRLTVSLDDGRTLPVARITVFPFADAESHSFRIRLYLEERTDGIAPGMLVRVDLAADERETLWIPAESLLQRGELRAVFVRGEQGRPRLRQVRVGVRESDRLEILSGLDVDDAVAARPNALFERAEGAIESGSGDTR
ncbi:MAG: efflux RND transporter periplasmic adaptor subunit [Wenzhouxiangellaceae bacterium]|nr:efflux RND transporter periplasmic adaptor subunit [Wenzhouxiangellaceae bacterium]MBS3746888.1 efflux RND transporter periplasmic adaptor subunit [Wenzhouxiangellaceae bacterium]